MREPHAQPQDFAELARLLRARICCRCPRATAPHGPADPTSPRACEATCPLFEHLPTLLAYADNMDPLVGSFDAVVNALAERCAPCREPGGARTPGGHRHDCPLVMFGHEVAGVLRDKARRLHRGPATGGHVQQEAPPGSGGGGKHAGRGEKHGAAGKHQARGHEPHPPREVRP